MKKFRWLHLLVASLAALLLGACASNTGIDAAKIATEIGHIEPSHKDTCDTQRQVAAQSSKIDTIIKGREVVYKADCKGS